MPKPNRKRSTVQQVTLSGRRFGLWTVLSDEASQGKVRARCDCGYTNSVVLANLQAGKSIRCRSCAARATHIKRGHLGFRDEITARLCKRVEAMVQRCTNPNDRSWHNYGGRGIKFCFASVREAVSYIKRELPHQDYLGVDIDREDNDSHYAPGNLRLATRQKNLRNTRRSVLTDEDHAWAASPGTPYAETTTLNMLRWGLTRKEIIGLAERAVAEKRKGWHKIAERLPRATTS